MLRFEHNMDSRPQRLGGGGGAGKHDITRLERLAGRAGKARSRDDRAKGMTEYRRG